ncbi:Transcription factor IIIA [Fusarium oxysporum f. sp. albedinis]|nr:Transcription factor IIIA [Fusarium oxysporum f. sp. albedinis]
MAQRIELQYEDQGSGDRVFPLSFLDTYFMPVDVVLVINATLDKDQLRTSLSKTLSLFPPVYGRFRRPSAATRGELSLDLYHPVPLYWQKDHQGAFYPSVWKRFINRITTKKVLDGQAPLLQITVTYLPHTSQTVLGRHYRYLPTSLRGSASSLPRKRYCWKIYPDVFPGDHSYSPPQPWNMQDLMSQQKISVSLFRKHGLGYTRRHAQHKMHLKPTYSRR